MTQIEKGVWKLFCFLRPAPEGQAVIVGSFAYFIAKGKYRNRQPVLHVIAADAVKDDFIAPEDIRSIEDHLFSDPELRWLGQIQELAFKPPLAIVPIKSWARLGGERSLLAA